MSNYKWCHGPNCHVYTTQDRVRGSKGSKVLRTRKINQNVGYMSYDPNNFYNYFCSNGCYNDFAHKHAQQIIKIAPRNEPLETPIHDPEQVKHEGYYGSYTTTEIKKRVDSESNVG